MNQRAIDIGEAIVRHEEAAAVYSRLMGELGAEQARIRELLGAMQFVGIRPASARPALPKVRAIAELADLIRLIDDAAASKELAAQGVRALGVDLGV